jgi:hypothetical protein
MALALRLAAHLSCTGLPMGLPFPRQGAGIPWCRTFGHGSRRGPSFRPVLRSGRQGSSLATFPLIWATVNPWPAFCQHAAQPNMRKNNQLAA